MATGELADATPWAASSFRAVLTHQPLVLQLPHPNTGGRFSGSGGRLLVVETGAFRSGPFASRIMENRSASNRGKVGWAVKGDEVPLPRLQSHLMSSLIPYPHGTDYRSIQWLARST